MSEMTFTPSSVRPLLGEDADQARADQPAGHDERDDEPVERDVEAQHELVEPLVHEADLDLAVAHLLEDVVHLVRQDSRTMRAELARSSLRDARRASRSGREALEHQVARVRLRDLEDVEVRVELDADRAERRDRLVEQDEARRQLGRFIA